MTVTDSKGQKHVFAGTKVESNNVLTNYTWSYQPAETKRPIVLNFLANDRLSQIQVVTALIPLGKLKMVKSLLVMVHQH